SLLGYTDERANAIFEQVRERVAAVPGVQSVSLSLRQPLALNFTTNTVFFPDRQQPGDRGVPVSATSVDREYFRTLGVPLIQGRNVTEADTPTAPRVAIVNDAFARTYWPGTSVIGKRFRLRGIDGPEVEIVGVVGNYKVRTVGEPPTPYIHYSMSRRQFTGQVVIARTSGDPEALVAAIRRAFLELEPNTVFFDAQPMSRQVDATLLPARLAAQTIGVVGLVATLLAAIGLYGVIAYSVARRTREIGIRMALGAQPSGVLGMVMRQGLAVSAAGLAVGSILAFLAARALSATLYGIGAADPIAWAGALGVLLSAALLANYIPARRAARVDPSVALRLQ
ncbi:MAG TPA: FtsX-like permease family protein, partial [Vicinamibacterales bacterium]